MNESNTNHRIKLAGKKKVAVIFGGGATRAFSFHIGVGKALQERGFNFVGGLKDSSCSNHSLTSRDISTYVGSSAGSLMAAALASGLGPEEILEIALNGRGNIPKLSYNIYFDLSFEKCMKRLKNHFDDLKLRRRSPYDVFKSLNPMKAAGLFSTRGIEEYFRSYILPSNSFSDLKADLYVVAAYLDYSKKVVFGKHALRPPSHDLTCEFDNSIAISDACAASAAVPTLFKPYGIRGKSNKINYFIDGDIYDTLATHVAVSSGADLIIVSYIYQPFFPTDGQDSIANLGMAAVLMQALHLMLEQRVLRNIHYQNLHRNTLKSFRKYCQRNGIKNDIYDECNEMLQKELHFYPEVDVIYIQPKKSDPSYRANFFSISPDLIKSISELGYQSALDVLDKYEFG